MGFRFSVFCLMCCALACLTAFHRSTFAADTPASPLLDVLDRFLAPGIPALGPSEVATPRNWPEPSSVPDRPGRGLAQHPSSMPAKASTPSSW